MKMPARLLPAVACALLLPLAAPAWAGADPKAMIDPAPEAGPAFPLGGEFDVEDSYAGDGDVRRDGRSHSLSENATLARVVLTPRIGLGYLRLGAQWERYSFGLGRRSPLPNTLQSVSLVLGLDTKFSDSILVRVEAQPGIYGASFDRLSSGDFNVPFLVGGTYIYSPDFQWILGVSVDLNRKYPVLPGVGVRWKFAPHLVANAVLPAPRLEYEVNRALTVYAGAELKGGSYRVDHDFGDQHGDGRLNHAVVSFSEVRAGSGLTWRVAPALTLTAEGGAQVAREFDFFRTEDRYRTDGLAPYGMMSLHGTF